MFNVTVIKLKDLVKIIAVVIIIYVFSQFVFKSDKVKGYFCKPITINTSDLVKFGINSESSIFKAVFTDKEERAEKTEEVEADFKNISTKSILNIGLELFKTKEQEKEFGQEVGQKCEENNETNTNSEEQKTATTQDITSDVVTTQVVTQNPIAEKYNKEYNGIKIKNETSYELTDDMLNPESFDIDKKDIIIFHTHTCESYTQTENNQYEPSRKLQNHKPKFFCCKSRRRTNKMFRRLWL